MKDQMFREMPILFREPLLLIFGLGTRIIAQEVICVFREPINAYFDALAYFFEQCLSYFLFRTELFALFSAIPGKNSISTELNLPIHARHVE